MQTPQNIAPNVPDRGALNGEIMTPDECLRMDIYGAVIRPMQVSLRLPPRIAENRVDGVEVIPAWMIGASRANISQMGR